MAALVSFMRGVGAPGTTAAECRVVSADFMVDVFAVRAGRTRLWTRAVHRSGSAS